jgi:hypothetical protein
VPTSAEWWEVLVFGKDKAARERKALEAAAEYLAAGIVRDQSRVEKAIMMVDASDLQYGVVALAERAVVALAKEYGSDPEAVLQQLLAHQPT